jgi:hypothetical protein
MNAKVAINDLIGGKAEVVFKWRWPHLFGTAAVILH